MGMIEGAIEREATMESSSSEARMSDASDDSLDDQDGGAGNVDAGVSMEESMRRCHGFCSL